MIFTLRAHKRITALRSFLRVLSFAYSIGAHEELLN